MEMVSRKRSDGASLRTEFMTSQARNRCRSKNLMPISPWNERSACETLQTEGSAVSRVQGNTLVGLGGFDRCAVCKFVFGTQNVVELTAYQFGPAIVSHFVEMKLIIHK